jgi:uncharacterized SAM-binding protein YcdF (DUF218 family)
VEGRPRFLFKLLIGLVALSVLAAATRSLWLGALGDFLVRGDPPVPADAALVLAGGETGSRILYAAEMARRGYVHKVLVSGPPLYGIHECDVAIAYVVSKGYPREWFVGLPHDGLSTRDEASLLLDDVRRMGVHRLLLVTSNFHTRRAGKLFRAKGRDLDIRVMAAPDPFFEPHSWWRSRQGQKFFVMEWSKVMAGLLGL